MAARSVVPLLPAEASPWHVEAFITSLTSSSEHTVSAYRSDVEHFLAWAAAMGAESPDAVDRALLRRYIAFLTTEGKAKRTVARKVSALRRYFGYLRRTGVVLSLIHI